MAFSSLQTERLEQKTKAIAQRAEACDGLVEAAFSLRWHAIMGLNQWRCLRTMGNVGLPLQAVAHHRGLIFSGRSNILGTGGGYLILMPFQRVTETKCLPMDTFLSCNTSIFTWNISSVWTAWPPFMAFFATQTTELSPYSHSTVGATLCYWANQFKPCVLDCQTVKEAMKCLKKLRNALLANAL